ncbi:RagB/SusD family nutrient uptake outer membrane protein [Sphingobacterium alkalisoli]|uniref:RagB/SusD family nutrient uptake outer membrane protein n=1 Tax=Sphingobacterium alkalisoli TaxID=1874115 RepID=A0A4V5LZ19_9SPHI|nr:RagB/SusD family nutrient uptake outer membrane protein [Sphingobacterium alkalisoli]TJY66949.1 RagB/SusD family nutrient uptake outer membrane protein [Sphingobacterium alkalisoli]GGH13210.1 membrane protein [Sphingobacterium alkalisoli]
MKKIILSGFIGTILLLSACNKFLDVKPTDFVAPVNYYTNEKDVSAAVAGIYDVLGKTSAYGRYLFFEMDISDEGFFGLSSNTQDIALYNYDIGDTKLLNTWTILYEGINRANMLLENIDKADMSDGAREVYRGEALFLRAYYYFVLTSNWGKIPLRLESTKSPSEVDMVPSTYADIYQRIVMDMEAAAEKVADVTTYTNAGRISKSAVWGVLARVNLKMAGAPLRDVARYAEAKEWAKKVIAYGYHRLNPDYSQVFKNYAQKVYDTRESIWEVEFSYQSGNQYEEGMVGSINGIGTSNTTVGYSYGAMRVMRPYYDSFVTGDERRDWNINDYTYAAAPSTERVPYTGSTATIYYNRYASKFRREFEVTPVKSTNTTVVNFPLVRYADVLLMYAEADNMLPGARSAEADEYINLVRRRAFGKLKVGATDIQEADLSSSLDELEFQEAIQKERSWELAFEGLRRFDLTRWNNYILTMKNLLSYKASANANYQYGFRTAENISERDTLYAIPRDEMIVNKLMKQNAGW